MLARRSKAILEKNSEEIQYIDKESTADFSSVTFDAPLNFNGFMFPGELLFCKCIFQSHVDFGYNSFQGKIDFDGSVFSGKLNLNNCDFFGAAVLSNCIFYEINFENAKLRDLCIFSGSSFQSKATFFNTIFYGNTDFSLSRLIGNITFSRAIFHSHTTYRGAVLNNSSFQGTQFLNQISFEDCIFSGDKNVFEAIIFSILNIRGADVSRLSGLEQKQIDSSLGDARTRLPKGLTRPHSWNITPSAEEVPPSAELDATNNRVPDEHRNNSFQLKVTPPIDFLWDKNKISAQIIAVPPRKRVISNHNINFEAKNTLLKSLRMQIKDLLEGIDLSQKNNGENILIYIRSIRVIIEQINKEIKKKDDNIIASYLRTKFYALSIIPSNDLETLDGVDLAQLKALIFESTKLWLFFPELLEIDDPYGADLIPDAFAESNKDFPEKVIHVISSAEARSLINDHVREILEVEKSTIHPHSLSDAKGTSENRESKSQIAKFGGILGNLYQALKHAPIVVTKIKDFIILLKNAKELWDTIKSLIT